MFLNFGIGKYYLIKSLVFDLKNIICKGIELWEVYFWFYVLFKYIVEKWEGGEIWVCLSCLVLVKGECFLEFEISMYISICWLYWLGFNVRIFVVIW